MSIPNKCKSCDLRYKHYCVIPVGEIDSTEEEWDKVAIVRLLAARIGWTVEEYQDYMEKKLITPEKLVKDLRAIGDTAVFTDLDKVNFDEKCVHFKKRPSLLKRWYRKLTKHEQSNS